MPHQNIRSSEEFNQLAETIRSLCAGDVPAYFPNPGNWGDSLIRAGTIEFFLHQHLQFRPIYQKQYRRKKRLPLQSPFHASVLQGLARQHLTAIYGGGGAWSASHGAGGYAFVTELCRYFKQVIVLPTSFQQPAVDATNVTYFARDVTMSRQSIPTANFCHDMAFFLQPLNHTLTRDVGYFLRTDKESLHHLGKVSGNLDISRMGDELSDPRQFFLELASCATIVTDRLHVAIAGGLLGRTTYLLPGAYWKNVSIYESSLKPLCPSVHFIAKPIDMPAPIAQHLHSAGAIG